MTPTDIIFLYFCVLAVRQLAWAMKDWEYRDHERIFWEKIEDSDRELDFWNHSGFCTNEYLINEIENRAFINALWPKPKNRKGE